MLQGDPWRAGITPCCFVHPRGVPPGSTRTCGHPNTVPAPRPCCQTPRPLGVSPHQPTSPGQGPSSRPDGLGSRPGDDLVSITGRLGRYSVQVPRGHPNVHQTVPKDPVAAHRLPRKQAERVPPLPLPGLSPLPSEGSRPLMLSSYVASSSFLTQGLRCPWLCLLRHQPLRRPFSGPDAATPPPPSPMSPPRICHSL